MMNNCRGILIRSREQTIAEVISLSWGNTEIKEVLQDNWQDIAFFGVPGATIVVSAIPNVGGDRQQRHRSGFELFGRRYYGDALIIGRENRSVPQVTPQEISEDIRFFHEE
jgi:hypothetical protein